MADIYSVDIPQGGSGAVNAGAADFLGMRQELLRQAALARQAQLDDERRQNEAAARALQEENIKSLAESRKAQALTNTEKANAMAQTQFAASHDVGTPLSDPEKAVALKLFGSNAVNMEPAQPADAGVSAEAPAAIAAPAEDLPAGAPVQGAHPAVPAKTTFAGTDEQKNKKSAKDLAHSILDGDYDTGDPDVNQEFKGWALSTLMTGKATTLPAGVVHPKTQSEKDSTRYFNTRASQKLQKPVSPEDVAFADAYEKIHPTEATKQADALSRIDVTVKAAGTRQTSSQTFQTKQQFRRELSDNEKTVDKDIERSDRALTLLSSPNFVTDAVAGPEFLQIVAGGMGSGLRMTDAELRRINDAQTKIDQFKGQLAKWDVLGIGDRRTIQDAMRAQMKAALEAVHAARERKAKLAEETLHALEDADTQDEIDTLHSKYWSDRRVQGTMSGSAAPAKAGGLTYNPATRKVE